MVPLREGILWLSHLKEKASKTARNYLYRKVGYKCYAGKQIDSGLVICQMRSDGPRAERKERGQLTLIPRLALPFYYIFLSDHVIFFVKNLSGYLRDRLFQNRTASKTY